MDQACLEERRGQYRLLQPPQHEAPEARAQKRVSGGEGEGGRTQGGRAEAEQDEPVGRGLPGAPPLLFRRDRRLG